MVPPTEPTKPPINFEFFWAVVWLSLEEEATEVGTAISEVMVVSGEELNVVYSETEPEVIGAVLAAVWLVDELSEVIDAYADELEGEEDECEDECRCLEDRLEEDELEDFEEWVDEDAEEEWDDEWDVEEEESDVELGILDLDLDDEEELRAADREVDSVVVDPTELE